MNKGDLDHGLAGSRQKFIVFAEPPAVVEPREATLDDPTFWQNLEDMSLGSLDYNQQATEHDPPPIEQLARVSAIMKHSLQTLEVSKQTYQHGSGSDPILDTAE